MFSFDAIESVIKPAIQDGKVFSKAFNSSRHINIGIKKLYSLMETAIQDSETAAETFIDLLFDQCSPY